MKKSKGGHPRFHVILQEMAALHDKKNSDYSKGLSQGPLGNFIRVSEIKKLYPGFDWDSPFGTAIDYMLKQFDAMMILRATKRDSLTGEPVASRLRDIEIYTVIAEIIEGEERAQVQTTRAKMRKMPESIATPKKHKRRRTHSKRYSL